MRSAGLGLADRPTCRALGGQAGLPSDIYSKRGVIEHSSIQHPGIYSWTGLRGAAGAGRPGGPGGRARPRMGRVDVGPR